MSTRYAPLLTLRCLHDYFPESKCQAMEIIPTQSTARVMQRLGVRTVSREAGMELYYEERPSHGGGLLAETKEMVVSLS
ncbi:MAG: hypothetical protein AAF597_10385, partial [Bacteroidota bacterium]